MSGFEVWTSHGTRLAADLATGVLCQALGPLATARVVARRSGHAVALLARTDGGILRAPGTMQPTSAVPVLLASQGGDHVASLGLSGGRLLTATPAGTIEANRTAVGGWETFSLSPSDEAAPALAMLDHPSPVEAACANASADASVLVGILAGLAPEELRRHLPAISQRSDYAQVFPFLRTVLSAGTERSGFATNNHLNAGISAYGWSIGDHTYGTPTIVDGQYGKLAIGRYCSIAGEVRIVVANHRMDGATTYPFAALHQFWPSASPATADHVGTGVVVGNSVWIGAGATLLPGARIGDGAVIGAMAVIAGTVPPYAVAVGNPGRVIRRRFDDTTIERLLATRWWDWPDHEVDRAIPLLLRGEIEPFLDYAEQRRARITSIS